MPANTYTLIEKIVIGATSAERITFTSIPQGYTDLKIVASVRSESPNPYDFIYGYVNGVSGIHYPGRRLRGDGSSASSATSNVGYFDLQYVNGDGATASAFGNLEIYFPNYSGSNQKSFSIDSVTETNSTTAYAHMWSYNYTNGTSAITSIVLASGSGYFKQYSSFYLYGIAKEGVSPSLSSAPYATGGDSILFDGTYWYHTFRSSGTFTPKKGLTADCLVVAGGGGGASGGGGAGGLLAYTSQSLTAQNYTVTVGAGGGGSANGANTTAGTSGSNSQFGSLTASVGGGGAGGALTNNAATGGSGGGGGGHDGAQTTGANGTSGQGNAGGGNGNFRGNPNIPAGGGGGAGGAGGSATSNTARGVGGAGSTSYSSWATATGTGVSSGYAGGGGGGAYVAGGTGGTATHGGGTGNSGSTNGVAGTANTGGGGGGSGQSGAAGAGGSGIVIVRYAA
jgi:hypothetical protein